jgi:hypothetical protein
MSDTVEVPRALLKNWAGRLERAGRTPETAIGGCDDVRKCISEVLESDKGEK